MTKNTNTTGGDGTTALVNGYDATTDNAYWKCMDKETTYFDDTTAVKYYNFACIQDSATSLRMSIQHMSLASVVISTILSFT